ncbi:hypothetical protein AVEN_124161-1 [Araneus ventricosus]|uniref:Uncharacterized protein n=1 Tax=Araneus ventricosus TaxID=182803 RepID=A0A4Y2P1G6_ARAVE|nr:hypothetical protein AVEN_124161-1 [Araneus ventricosus]
MSLSTYEQPLQNTENFSHEQGSHSRSPDKENTKSNRKRRRSVTDNGNIASKRLRSEFPSDLQDEFRQDLSAEERKFAKSVAGRENTPSEEPQLSDSIVPGSKPITASDAILCVVVT